MSIYYFIKLTRKTKLNTNLILLQKKTILHLKYHPKKTIEINTKLKVLNYSHPA